MSCSMSIEQKMCQVKNISTPIYVKCDMMYWSKVCVQEFSFFVSGLDIQLEQSEYDSPVCKKISCRWHHGKIGRVMYCFFVVKVSHRESGDMGSIPDECWNALPSLGRFAWHWARQCTDGLSAQAGQPIQYLEGRWLGVFLLSKEEAVKLLAACQCGGLSLTGFTRCHIPVMLAVDYRNPQPV